MNRVLITARCVSNADEAALAELLGISVADYQAVESRKKALTPEYARKLGAYFDVPPWYFLAAAGSIDTEERIRLLRRQLDTLKKPEHRPIPAAASVALTTTIIELMISKEELAAALLRELDLAEELAAVTRIYEHLYAQVTTQPVKRS